MKCVHPCFNAKRQYRIKHIGVTATAAKVSTLCTHSQINTSSASNRAAYSSLVPKPEPSILEHENPLRLQDVLYLQIAGALEEEWLSSQRIPSSDSLDVRAKMMRMWDCRR